MPDPAKKPSVESEAAREQTPEDAFVYDPNYSGLVNQAVRTNPGLTHETARREAEAMGFE